MFKLLKFEFRKLYQMKAFWVCACIAVLMVAVGVLTSNILSNGNIEGLDSSIYSSYYFINTAMSSSMIVTISAIFVSIFATEDINQMTLKNIVAKGYAKKDIYLSKYIVSLISILVIYALSVVASFLGGLMFESTYIPNNFALSIICQLVLILAYHALYFNIAIISSKLSTAISLCIIGPMILSMVLGLLDNFLNIEGLKLQGYYLDQLASSLQNLTSDASFKIIVTSFVYIIITSIIGIKVTSKKEV